jgi:hypothetical protein
MATPDSDSSGTAEDALWLALMTAPDQRADIAELMRASGMTRPTLYRHLTWHAQAGRAGLTAADIERTKKPIWRTNPDQRVCDLTWSSARCVRIARIVVW